MNTNRILIALLILLAAATMVDMVMRVWQLL